MKNLVITYNKFPEGDAGSVRNKVLGKLIDENLEETLFIGMGDSNYLQIIKNEDFNYTSLRKSSSKNKLFRIIYYLFYPWRMKKYLLKILEKNNINNILINELPIFATIIIKKICREKNISLIADSVEWYSSEQFKLRKLSPSYIKSEIHKRCLIDKNFKVIAISSFLENYFKKRGNQTIRVPFVFDKHTIDFKEKKIKKNKIIYTYAGNPGKKDYLDIMLKGFSLIKKERLEKIEIRIFGINYNDLLKKCEIKKEILLKLENSLKIYGRVDRKKIIENYVETNYTILLRSSKLRYAQAGFPTKVVESLFYRTPVILNLTSDLKTYIKESENGLIVDECTPEEFKKVIEKSLEILDDDYKKMSESAYKSACLNFDYRLYKKELKDKFKL